MNVAVVQRIGERAFTKIENQQENRSGVCEEHTEDLEYGHHVNSFNWFEGRRPGDGSCPRVSVGGLF